MLVGLGTLLGSRTTNVSADEIRSRTGIMGIGLSTRSVPVTDVEYLEVAPDGQMGSGAKYQVYHSIRAIPVAGRGYRTLHLAAGIRGIDDASTVARAVTAETGIEFREVSRKERRGPRKTRLLEKEASRVGSNS